MNRFAHLCIVMVGALLTAAQPTPAHAATDDIVPTELTGNWFDPARDGEGCNLTLEGDGQSFILSCYTYLSGKQVWLIGAAQLDSSVNELIVDNVTLTHGAQFGTAFRAEDVVRENWGHIVLSFDSCNTALIAFTPTDPRFEAFNRCGGFNEATISLNENRGLLKGHRSPSCFSESERADWHSKTRQPWA